MSITQTTAGGENKRSLAARWSVLPDELLDMVRSRVASPHDRVRVAAVCKSWRAAASPQQPTPAATPLLLLSPRRQRTTKHLCGPRGCWEFRAPAKTLGKQFVGFHDGGWVAAVDHDGLSIVNLFSGAELELSEDQSLTSPVWPRTPPDLWANNIRKVVFSEAPTSSGCILAAITYHVSMVAVCKIGCRKGGWTRKDWFNKVVLDIVFCNGELYCLHPGEELIKFKINMKEGEYGGTVITNIDQMSIQRLERPTWEDDRVIRITYIFELRGKLAVAVRTCWLPERDHFFKVFELVDTDGAYNHKWIEVTSFGDYSMFLGPTGSKAVHVSSSGHHGLKRNHIYYSFPATSCAKIPCDQLAYSIPSENGHHMVCREYQSVGDGVGRIGYYVMGWDSSATWLQHADF